MDVLASACVWVALSWLHPVPPAAAYRTPARSAAETGGTTTPPAGEPPRPGPSPGGAPQPGPVERPRPPDPCGIRRLHLRCPDLVMSAPSQLHLDRTTIGGHVLLRARSSVNNRGRGPLELRARRLGPHRWRVYQAVYDERGQPHLFRTSAELAFKLVPGERYGYGYVPPASYWKVQHVSAFELWSLGPRLTPVKLVRTGPKVDYCIRDLFRTAPSSDSPSEPVYPACSQDPTIGLDTFGTSAGWSDVYPYSYPEQWIDVTGLRGRFAFVMRADPDGALIQSSRNNDLSETYLALPSGRVLGHRVAVSAP